MRRGRKAAGGPRQPTAGPASDGSTTLSGIGEEKAPPAGKPGAASTQPDGDSESAAEKSVLDVLAEGVHNSWALLHTAVIEFLACKDEILKHALPPALLLRIVVSTSKIFRLFSDANTPMLELLRLVKLYSADWEKQSAALKKLHADNESKQRQLNIALRRIEMTAMEQQRMAKERRVMNWERLFAKLHNRQSHGRRWKFLMQSFKDKLRDGKLNPESYAPSKSDSENEEGEDYTSCSVANAGVRPTSHLRLFSREGSLDVSAISLDPTNGGEEDSKAGDSRNAHEQVASESPSGDDTAEDMEEAPHQLSVRQLEDNGTIAEEDSRTRLNSDNSSATVDRTEDSQQQQQQQQGHDRGDVRADSLVPVKAPVETSDTGVCTHEPEYRRCLGLRVYAPRELKGFSSAAVTVSLGDQVFNTDVFDLSPVSLSGGAPKYHYGEFEFQLPPTSKYDESAAVAMAADPSSSEQSDQVTHSHSSIISSSNSSALLDSGSADTGSGEEEHDTTLNIVLHSKSPQGPIVAMTTVPLKTLLVGQLCFTVCPTDDHEIYTSMEEGLRITQLTGSDVFQIDTQGPTDFELRPMAGGMPSKLPLLPFHIKMEVPITFQKATETVPLEELVAGVAGELGFVSMEEAAALVKEREEEHTRAQQEYGVAQDAEVSDIQDEYKQNIATMTLHHAEELVVMQTDYESKMLALTESLDELKRQMVTPPKGHNEQAEQATQTSGMSTPSGRESHSATKRVSVHSMDLPESTLRHLVPGSPLHPVPLAKASRTPPPAGKTMRKRSSRVSHPMPADWMENIPKDFLERLEHFTQASMERHQILVQTVRHQVQSIFSQQMAANHRLRTHVENEELCLPALYLPTQRPKVIFTPKAHSYFHPAGSTSVRVSQPPSILSLPPIPRKQPPAISTVNLFELSQKYGGADSPYLGKGKAKKTTFPTHGSNPPPSLTHLRSFVDGTRTPKSADWESDIDDHQA